MSDWRDRAACFGTWPDLDFMFPGPAEKALCDNCDVPNQCLRDAGPYGLWGGKVARERLVELLYEA